MDTSTLFVVRVNADGNCLCNTISLAQTDNKEMNHLRAFTPAGLYLHSDLLATRHVNTEEVLGGWYQWRGGREARGATAPHSVILEGRQN